MSLPSLPDKYVPTKAEERLLEVLANPENRQKNITDICQLADISRETYYAAFRKPDFVKKYKDLSFELVKQSVAPVLHAVIQRAKEGSYYHSRMILEMAGLYTEKKELQVGVHRQEEDEERNRQNVNRLKELLKKDSDAETNE